MSEDFARKELYIDNEFYELPQDCGGKGNILYIEVEFNSETQSRLLRRKTLRGRKLGRFFTFI
jgi:hypothetical protein